jgi:hypothetical protein
MLQRFLHRTLMSLIFMTCGGITVSHGMPLDANLCDQAAELAAQSSNTPLEVLQAISRVETGRSFQGEMVPWPWTVNFAGKGYWFETQNQAFDFAQTLFARGEDNFDLGCFQVNQHWHGDKFATLSDALSPETNAMVAAEFLQSLYDSSGDWGVAVASYHSKTETYGQKYLAKVEAILQDRRAQPRAEQSDSESILQVQSRNNFPLLQQGQSNNGPSLVPIGLGGMPLFTVSP